MAPGYRNQNRRQNRTGYVDHDVFEGLPVRHWRRDFVTVTPPPIQDNTTSQNDIWAVELPYGMPRDSHLLPQHSQDLLRAARSGKIYKRPAPAEEEVEDTEVVLGEKPEKKDEDPKDKGFTARAWKQIPRHLEGPDIEYLAKRRKGLVTFTQKAPPSGPTLTKTTVKRIDAAGNEYVQDVVVPHGQQVEGEVISQTIIPDPNVNIDSYAVQPTPSRRKGPASRKKAKGPGRGRKKKSLASTSVPVTGLRDGGTLATAGDGVLGPDGVTSDIAATATNAGDNEDTEMGDGSIANSSDEDGEEGDDNDEDEDSIDHSSSPSKLLSATPPLGIAENMDLESNNIATLSTELSQTPPKLLTDPHRFDAKSGSPLKNLALTNSTLPSPLETNNVPSFSPVVTAPVQTASPILVAPVVADLDEIMQQETLQSAPNEVPVPPLNPTRDDVASAMEERKAEEEEEAVLLDMIGGTKKSSTVVPGETSDGAGLEIPVVESVSQVPQEMSLAGIVAMTTAHVTGTSLPTLPGAGPEPESSADTAMENAPQDDEDDSPDLLGGLEKSLESTTEETRKIPDITKEETGSPVTPKVEGEVEIVGETRKTAEFGGGD